MSATLTALAVQLGLPILEKILSRKIGDTGGQLVTDVIRTIADRAGISVDGLDQAANDNPGRVIDAMRDVERMAPELVALYAAGLEGQFALLQAEQKGPWFAWAWRPAWMFFLMFLWFWNIVALHVANAYWKIALPPVPYEILLSLTGLYLALYMGGHTIKDVASKWVGK